MTTILLSYLIKRGNWFCPDKALFSARHSNVSPFFYTFEVELLTTSGPVKYLNTDLGHSDLQNHKPLINFVVLLWKERESLEFFFRTDQTQGFSETDLLVLVYSSYMSFTY